MEHFTFKLFHQEEIRRVTIARPTFPRFLEFLQELFGGLKPDVKVSYVDSDGDKITVNSEVEWNCALEEMKGQKILKFNIESGVAKKNKVNQPKQLNCRFYTKAPAELEKVPDSKLQVLTGTIPSMLEKYFEGNVISAKTVPEWLSCAVEFVPVSETDFDLDVDLNTLFHVLHKRAYDLLGTKDFLKAKFIFLDCLLLFPENIYALYNLACAESLLGEAPSALNYLKSAAKSGYKNWKHMELDEDLKNIRETPEFKELLSSMKQEDVAKAQEKAMKEREVAEKLRLEAEKIAQAHEQEAKKRAVELIKFAEQRRQKLEEESRQRAAQAVEQAMKEQALKQQAELEKAREEERAREQERIKQEAAEAERARLEEAKADALAQKKKKWASVVQQLSDMGFDLTPEHIEKLDQVQGDIDAFFDAL